MLGGNKGLVVRMAGLLACLAVILFTACSSEPVEHYANRKSTFPVKGQLLVNNQPAAGAFIVLYPVNEPAEPTDPRPQATVAADGSFTISTYGEADGAPAGDYRVTITWEGGADEPDKLGGRYADVMQSKIKVTVKEGSNELEPIRLQ